MKAENKQILVLNAGSSSLKLGLFEWESLRQLDEKNVSWGKGADTGLKGHQDALNQLLNGMDTKAIAAIGYRVVQGGNRYTRPVRLDAKVKDGLKELVALAPLHNQAALEVIEAVENVLPGIPQVATFDTIFHQTLEPAEYLYPVPYEWFEKWGVRRFGFHGLSYTYCCQRAPELLGRGSLAEIRLVACHLGSGCSLAAIRGGQSVATTMGFTPLEGLMMGSRSGSIDPGLLLYLQERGYLSRDELDNQLNHASGLKGISGTGDFQEVLSASQNQDDKRASLAFEMFVNRLCQGIAAMAAAMGGLDGLIMTGGIGEHSYQLRQRVAERLSWLSLEIDDDRNRNLKGDGNVASASSQKFMLVIHTREELVVAQQTYHLLAEQ